MDGKVHILQISHFHVKRLQANSYSGVRVFLHSKVTLRDGVGNWADDVVVGIQNGTNTLFSSVKVSMNDTELEHNKRVDLGTFVNLLEYSPDYASSIDTQSGFSRDTVTTPVDGNNPSYRARASVVGTIDNGTHQVSLHCYVPLKNISQFFRRLSFPIVNQKFQLQLDLNINGCIRRANGVQDGRLVYESVPAVHNTG